MRTLRIGRYEAFFQVNSLPVEGLFRTEKSGRGELFVDIGKLEIILTDHKAISRYFNKEENTHDPEEDFNEGRQAVP